MRHRERRGQPLCFAQFCPLSRDSDNDVLACGTRVRLRGAHRCAIRGVNRYGLAQKADTPVVTSARVVHHCSLERRPSRVVSRVWAVVASAHHGFGSFEVNKTVSFPAAKLTRIELVNPHPWLYLTTRSW